MTMLMLMLMLIEFLPLKHILTNQPSKKKPLQYARKTNYMCIKRLRFLRAFYVYANFEQVTAYFYVANSCFKCALWTLAASTRFEMVTVLKTLFRCCFQASCSSCCRLLVQSLVSGQKKDDLIHGLSGTSQSSNEKISRNAMRLGSNILPRDQMILVRVRIRCARLRPRPRRYITICI